MAKSIKQKENIIKNYSAQVQKASAIFFFSGSLNSAKTQIIKKEIKGKSSLSLIKNTLFNKAAKEQGLELDIDGYNNALFTEKDPIGIASFLSKFLSENEYKSNKVVIGKTVYEGNKLKQISGLGSESQVYTQLVSTMMAAPTKLVVGLQNPMQKLVYVLSQIKK